MSSQCRGLRQPLTWTLRQLAAAMMLLGLAAAQLNCGAKENPAVACPLISSPVTYANTMQNWLQLYCVTCHSVQKKGLLRAGAPPDINYDTYANAVAAGPEGRMAVMGGVMPPNLGLDSNAFTVAQRCQFNAWAENGYAQH